MGKEWHWSTGRFARSGEKESPGCMSGVLHLFDFHQFQFPMSQQPCFKPNSVLQEDPISTVSKGVQAPRNSLESEEENLFEKASSQSRDTKEEHLVLHDHIPVAKTGAECVKVARIRVDELSSSESTGSPGPKTPTLVARLMGLDLLPDERSPSSTSSAKRNKAHHHRHLSQDQNVLQSRQLVQSKTSSRQKITRHFEEISGSRSLPETPRISSARRSDVDASRLSLQINKENTMVREEFDYLSRSCREQQKSRRREYRSHEDQENRSPSHYARQLVKQVKENVSRKVGLDITNMTSRDASAEREANALAPKSKKPKRPSKTGEEASPSKQTSTTTSSSPRIRSVEHKAKPFQDQLISSTTVSLRSSPPVPLSAPITVLANNHQAQSNKLNTIRTKSQPLSQHRTTDKCKKASCERFTQRKEAVARACPAAKANLNLPEKKCKIKTPLLKDLVAVNKEQSIPSTQLAQAPTSQTEALTHSGGLQLQAQASKPFSQLSSSSSRASYDQHFQSTLPFDGHSPAEFRYVSEILKRTGIDRDTVVSFTRWFSPTHPLDPSIFDSLENSSPVTISPLPYRYNRKLIFDLVDEILADTLKPYLNLKPWMRSITKDDLPHHIRSVDQLLHRLCSKIQSFPSANCQILQDIDDLIELDLPDPTLVSLTPIFEEAESIVFDIERDLLNSLVSETAAAIMIMCSD